jgi:hypothetical protein
MKAMSQSDALIQPVAKVYVLTHSHLVSDEDEDEKLLGVFTSAEAAARAQHRAQTLPGFRDSPKEFATTVYSLDTVHTSRP